MKKSLLFVALLSIANMYAQDKQEEFYDKMLRKIERIDQKRQKSADESFFAENWGKITGLAIINQLLIWHGEALLKKSPQVKSQLSLPFSTDISAYVDYLNSKKTPSYKYFSQGLTILSMYATYKKIRSLEARVN